MEEVDPRARVWKARVDPKEVDLEEATHLWNVSVCRNWGQQKEPVRQSGL